jgi:hypothetical protein
MRTPNLEGCGISIGSFEKGWKELAPNLNVFQFGLVVTKDLSLFVIGGQQETSIGFDVTDRVIQYKVQDRNPGVLKHIEMEPMSVGRADVCCTINNLTNEIYVIGGHRSQVDT